MGASVVVVAVPPCVCQGRQPGEETQGQDLPHVFKGPATQQKRPPFKCHVNIPSTR